MNHFAPALDIANAVLYEGYILFPYTASAGKNRIRWQFGVVVPQAYAANGTGEPALAQTEVLLEYEPSAHLEVLVRFLQVEARLVETWNGAHFEPVQELAIDGTRHLSFDEGVEREIRLHLRPELESRVSAPIAFPAEESADELHGVVNNVVFPTGIDRRDDIGCPDRFDVYYGMADNRIGAARLDLPDCFPECAETDPKLPV